MTLQLPIQCFLVNDDDDKQIDDDDNICTFCRPSLFTQAGCSNKCLQFFNNLKFYVFNVNLLFQYNRIAPLIEDFKSNKYR